MTAALVAGTISLTATPTQAAEPAIPPDGTVTTPAAQAKASSNASEQARASGTRVEVAAQRTEDSKTYANPDGTLTQDRYLRPVHVRRNGAFVDADDTLVAGKDGLIHPKATRVKLAFSGGGNTAPLATMAKDGREITLTWPGALPVPTLSGDTATYPDVLPGVDLKLVAETDSFSHLLVVKTPEAARNPALAELSFGLTGRGLDIRANPDGSLSAVTGSGQSIFTAPPPAMWDSRGAQPATAPAARPETPAATTAFDAVPQPSVDPVEGAPDGAKQAPLAVELSGDTLQLTPDPELLTAPNTTFPVIIDPVWRDDWKYAYAIAYKHNAMPGTANTAYWNGGTLSKEARVGCSRDWDQGGAAVCAKTFFNIDVRNLWDKHVLSATLRIKQTYAGSWSCRSGEVELWTTEMATPQTTWNNQPPWRARVSASGTSFGGRACPTAGGADMIEFEATSAIAQAARDHWYAWGLGIKSKVDTVDVSWRKFDPNTAVVSTNYNTPPTVPYDRSTDPWTPCSGGTFGLNDHVTLRARLNDTEDNQVTAIFHYWRDGIYQPVERTQQVVRGNIASVQIPTAGLQSGTYRWDVVAYDGVSWSPWAGQCLFTIDKDRPSQPPTVSSPQYPDGDGGTWGAPARTDGDFTFGANGVTDVVRYVWSTDLDPVERIVDATGPNGTATITHKPLTVGPQQLFVRSEDAAGNRSDTRTYLYYASTVPGADAPGDLNGDGNTDIWAVDRDTGELTVHPGDGEGGFGVSKTASSLSFASASITHRGDWTDDGYEDLLSLQPGADGTKTLYAHTNAGDGTLRNPNDGRHTLRTYEPGNHHWSNAEQILSLGSIDGDTVPELIVREGDRLWLYYGAASRYLDENLPPVPLSDAGWTGKTLMTPGDITGDGLPELWFRNDATGTVHQLAGAKDTDGNVDLAAWSDPQTATPIGSGLTAAAYPSLTSTGDLENNATGTTKYPDLWGHDTEGRVFEFPGQAPSGGSAFGPARLLVTTGIPWGQCETISGHSLCGPILAKYKSLKARGSLIGLPTTGVLTTPDNIGRFAHFGSYSIYWSPATGAWEVHGDIRNKWEALGWETGPLGYPTSDEYATPNRSGFYNTFQKGAWGGAVYWHPAIGAHAMYGDIYAKYRDNDGFAKLGYPTTDEISTPDNTGRYNHFRRSLDTQETGSIYWTADLGAHIVTGHTRDYWAANGWEAGALGYPHSDTVSFHDNVGQATYFNFSGVYWTEATGAHRVFGNINAKYIEAGGPAKLGYPESDETATPDDTGRYNTFSQYAAIYWTNATGANVVRGDIRTKWAALGWETGVGYPLTDELPTWDLTGRYNAFTNDWSIYWHPDTGAWSIHGLIRDAWVQNGAETGPLGYPVSDEHDAAGLRRSNFQHGWITWNPTNGAITIGTS